MLSRFAGPAAVALLTGLSVVPLCTLAAESSATVAASEVAPSVVWKGQQYPGVDGRGRVFLLRTEKLALYPVGSGGELGEPRPFESGSIGTPAPVLDARMDEHGDWVLLHGAEVRWFRSGEEEPVPPLPWRVAAVELLDGRPLVAALPLAHGRVERRELHPVPRLLTAGKDDWSILVESDLDAPADPRAIAPEQEHASHLLVDGQGDVWLAYHYRYRVLHYSSGGRELLTLEAGDAEVRHRERDDPEVEKAARQLEEQRARHAAPRSTRTQVNTAVPVILDLAEGRDGRLLLLVRPPGEGGSLVLDRLDLVRGVVERVPVAIRTPGAMSLAAGKDGLYLVPFNGLRKRFFIPWEALEGASWESLEGVELNGAVLPPLESDV